MRRYIQLDHAAVAAAAKKAPGTWELAGVYASSVGGRGAVHRITRIGRMPAYQPAGAFEAYSAPHQDGGTAVWVRYVAGLPQLSPRPSAMTYRVCDRGTGTEYVGLQVVTVTVGAECPSCGGPRGEAQPYRFVEDGEWHVVDRWTNGCGHIDYYPDVLAEHRDREARLDAGERKAASRVRTSLGRAGEFTEAVRLLTAAADEIRGLHAKQAAVFLATRGQQEAARLIAAEAKLRTGHMSARQAAVFLVELAAARAACTACENGRIARRDQDGDAASSACPTCRKDES